MKESRRLGMGLDALIGGQAEDQPAVADQHINVSDIVPNPFQPRTEFDETELKQLAESMKGMGLIQPIVVRRVNGHYELVAGERRFRAAKLAGLTKLPAVVKQLDDKAMLRFALVENIQRKDLNPLEKARAFKELMSRFNYTQEQIAGELGIDRTTVSNFIRLLDLPAEIQEAIARGLIHQGHARALLAVPNGEQVKLLREIVKNDLSVREVERIVYNKKPTNGHSNGNGKHSNGTKDPQIADLEEKLEERFGTRCRIDLSKKGGTITIEFYSTDHLNNLLEQLGVSGG